MSHDAENDRGSWWRDTPESRRLLAIETHRLAVAEATYGLDKRQARRVRRRMGRPVLPPAESVPDMLARVAAEEEAHADDNDRPHYRASVTPPAEKGEADA